ncbi:MULTISPECIES: glycoside hydrolase family 19 protein [Elizabethkingia]|uniref:glycoside hydrolase family 19 protein n=1 Tax=Elizabethkingia TaxID=308865 RepID=UPI003158BC06
MTNEIILRKLKAVGANMAMVPDNIADLMSKYGITTEENFYIFLANVLNETGGFKLFIENMNYKTAQRLREVFPRAFRTKYNPANYIGQPEKLGNLVYDSRIFPNLGLGNDKEGDGYKYRGRGLIQSTGKYLYGLLSKEYGVDFVKNPDLLATKEYALLSALYYWKTRKMGTAGSLIAARRIMAGIKSGVPEGYSTVLNYYNNLKAA